MKINDRKKTHVIGHPNRSPEFDGIGPMSWNLACFKKTLTTKLSLNFQHKSLRYKETPVWLATLASPLYSVELVPGPETSPVSRNVDTELDINLQHEN